MSGGGTETFVGYEAATSGGDKKRDSLGTTGSPAHLIIKDLGEIHSRLLDHRPVIQGETRYFVKEFEYFWMVDWLSPDFMPIFYSLIPVNVMSRAPSGTLSGSISLVVPAGRGIVCSSIIFPAVGEMSWPLSSGTEKRPMLVSIDEVLMGYIVPYKILISFLATFIL
uniref:Biogenesis of lysosome-related organelles complex 1 subunit 5 n=1 Tax=Equus caballus TaxID=9796 RepID=A0A9L0SWF0_HORSE